MLGSPLSKWLFMCETETPAFHWRHLSPWESQWGVTVPVYMGLSPCNYHTQDLPFRCYNPRPHHTATVPGQWPSAPLLCSRSVRGNSWTALGGGCRSIFSLSRWLFWSLGYTVMPTLAGFCFFFFWIHATLTLLLNMGYIKVMWAIKNYCYSEAFLSM